MGGLKNIKEFSAKDIKFSCTKDSKFRILENFMTPPASIQT